MGTRDQFAEGSGQHSRPGQSRPRCGALAENVGPLKDKGGWVASDATAFDTAIAAVEQFDMQQHSGVTVEVANLLRKSFFEMSGCNFPFRQNR